MLCFVKIQELAEKIDPTVFSEYLENTGWCLVTEEELNFKGYRCKRNDILYQAVIPLDRECGLFKFEMYRAAEAVASAEHVFPEQIVARLLGLENEEKDIVFVVR